jgi:hypothetical protein
MKVGKADEASFEAIRALQRANQPAALTPDEQRTQGFVSLTHTLDDLRAMHAIEPSIVAHDDEGLVGYALVMPIQTRPRFPVLEPMFARIAEATWRGRPLADRSFYVMGQVCVAKRARGTGVFDALYAGHARALSSRFDCVVTEIAVRNARSMRAHARVGFDVVTTYVEDQEWAVVAWDFRRG